jgi:hypothetical protein
MVLRAKYNTRQEKIIIINNKLWRRTLLEVSRMVCYRDISY